MRFFLYRSFYINFHDDKKNYDDPKELKRFKKLILPSYKT